MVNKLHYIAMYIHVYYMNFHYCDKCNQPDSSCIVSENRKLQYGSLVRKIAVCGLLYCYRNISETVSKHVKQKTHIVHAGVSNAFTIGAADVVECTFYRICIIVWFHAMF